MSEHVSKEKFVLAILNDEDGDTEDIFDDKKLKAHQKLNDKLSDMHDNSAI